MIKPGSRWKSQTCNAEAVVVRPPSAEGTPQCGGIDMVAIDADAESTSPLSGFDSGCQVGKRYRQESTGLEMLCTKPGQGSLGFAGVALDLVEAKKLPSSD